MHTDISDGSVGGGPTSSNPIKTSQKRPPDRTPSFTSHQTPLRKISGSATGCDVRIYFEHFLISRNVITIILTHKCFEETQIICILLVYFSSYLCVHSTSVYQYFCVVVYSRKGVVKNSVVCVKKMCMSFFGV